MDHQRSRCLAGTDCQRVHVSCKFMHQVRNVLLRVPFSNSCLFHADFPSQCPNFDGIHRHFALEILTEGLTRFFVSPGFLASTAYWDNLKDRPISEVFAVKEKRVCRLHQQHRCNQGPSCGNVHICREVWNLHTQLLSMHDQGSSEYAYFVRQTAHQTLEMVWGTMDDIHAWYSAPSPLVGESIQRLRACSQE